MESVQATYVEEDPKALQKTLGMGKKKVDTFYEFMEALHGKDGKYTFYVLRNAGSTTTRYNPQTKRDEEYPVIFVDEKTVQEGEELENAWINGEFFYCVNVDEEKGIYVVRGL